jgi:antigen flippase
MKSIFKATALLGSSSIVSILVGVLSCKVLASVLEPSGYGYYGLLQSFVTVASLLAGMGLATGLVRFGATSAAEGNRAAMSALCGGAWLLFIGIVTPMMFGVLILFWVPISRLALGSTQHSSAILLMGIAIWFTVAMNVQTGILNAWHRVGALAQYSVVCSVLNAATTIVAVWIWGAKGVAPAVIASAIGGWATSRYFLYRNELTSPVRTTFREKMVAARKLLWFGLPFTASVLAGNGMQLAMPMVVVHLLSTEGVGYYKATVAISVGYLGFLITAMTQDYYPRISAVKNKPEAMVSLINEQQRLIMLLAGPMILFTLALVSYIIPLIYSRHFLPAVGILEWQLIGDLFKLSSWTISFAILARCKTHVFFLTEAIFGVLSLCTTWLSVHLFGISGLGISFFATYVIYYATVWIILRRELPLFWTTYNKYLALAVLAIALTIRILPSTPLASHRTLLALGLATAFGIYSCCMLWAEYSSQACHEDKPDVPSLKACAATQAASTNVLPV